jgi:hypothetical protein
MRVVHQGCYPLDQCGFVEDAVEGLALRVLLADDHLPDEGSVGACVAGSARLLVRVVHLEDRLALDSASMLALECLAASGQRQHLADDRPQPALVNAARELDELGAVRLHHEEDSARTVVLSLR